MLSRSVAGHVCSSFECIRRIHLSRAERSKAIKTESDNLRISDRPPQRILSQRSISYIAALISVGAATLVRIVLSRVIGPTAVPFITYFPAVVFSAWLGGLGPGIVSLAVGAVLADYLFLPPIFSFAIQDPADVMLLGTFLVVGFGIV